MAKRIERKEARPRFQPNFALLKEQKTLPSIPTAIDPVTGRKLLPAEPKSEEWHAQERAKKLAPSDGNRKRMRHCITVPVLTMALARKIGTGNASKGIEIAVEEWHERTGTRKRGPKPREPQVTARKKK